MSARDGATGEVLVRGLFQEHGAALLAYATRLTGERARGEDVVRETLIRAWRSPVALADGRGSVRAHLFATVQSIATEKDQGAIDAMIVLSALDSLEPDQRQVLDAVYFQGHDVTEAADSLGLPPATVKSRTTHALRRLREAVAG